MQKYLAILLLSLILFPACNKEKKEEAEKLDAYLAENNITAEPTETGMYYIETVEGTGEQAVVGSTVSVHYEGRLLDGTVFDSSYERNSPFEFTLGYGYVISGWDEGIAYMKEGGKATLIIPSNLAYGASGSGSVIPPYSTLVFDVELLDVKK